MLLCNNLYAGNPDCKKKTVLFLEKKRFFWEKKDPERGFNRLSQIFRMELISGIPRIAPEFFSLRGMGMPIRFSGLLRRRPEPFFYVCADGKENGETYACAVSPYHAQR